MATLNLSSNGPSITKSYQSIVNSPSPSGQVAKSPTYGQWAVYSVSAPLVNAFQQDAGGKESVLKVLSTGEGELVDLIDEFSDGKIQFAFVKVKDPNTALPKNVLIGWCGEGVPERTKGYFTSHLTAVSKVLHGYHVQITARSERDLTPEGVVQKVSDASGSKYSASNAAAPSNISGPPPPAASKPAFTPTRVGGGNSGFNPLAGSRPNASTSRDAGVDEDGWGEDAPQVTRTQLEKVQSAYRPTKVNMSELTSQKQEPSRFNGNPRDDSGGPAGVVRGAYQPVGKVDIAAIRRQAQESGSVKDDRPSTVKGSYEPVGKVDIAAIRARAQKPPEESSLPLSEITPAAARNSARSTDEDAEPPKTVADRSAAFAPSERLTSLPKPKVSNRFGSSANTFTGTKAPAPGVFGLGSKAAPSAPPVGTASRTFADEGGKTPAQIWAEKKARQSGVSGASENLPTSGFGGPTSPMASQQSGSAEWKSGYGGKSWAPVQTTATGRSATSNISQQRTGQDEEQQEETPSSPGGGVSAIRDRFKGAVPMGAPVQSKSPTPTDSSAQSPPSLHTSSKPNPSLTSNRGIPIPGLPPQPARPIDEDDVRKEEETSRMLTPPPQPPRSPTPPTPPGMRSGSPIRVAMPVGRGNETEIEAPEERFDPPPMPTNSLARAVGHEDDVEEEPAGYDPARGAGTAAAASSFGQTAAESAQPSGHESGKRALVQYDYDKAEENELELKEGEYVTHIEMVDEDWWMGRNEHGETGLFPSNYVELVEDEQQLPGGHEHTDATPPAGPVTDAMGVNGSGPAPAAVATYDYEAAEENELSFPEGAKITGIEFPDEDWWFGEYGGKSGLFPANYVQLEE
ncbi:MAG: hypothetical protein M1827_006967 [Pycnora praestabilis]|nr:MAG: hypothetical protein M1827_006967 [Pycnora praestabilis]